MKTLTITWAAAAILAVFAFKGATKEPIVKDGLYITPNDFQHNKISYAGGSSGGQTKIKIHEGLFGSAKVDVIYDGKKQVFSTSQVYGYRDSKGQDYRFFDRAVYRIVDTGGFYLYSCNKLVQGQKIARPQTLYYFSVGASDLVQSLTLANLEIAFPRNTRFRYAVEALKGQFGSDAALATYDGVLKTYKIKYLYSQSIQ
jgi:hypothetical protein